MKRNNVRLLTDQEMEFVKNKYNFILIDDKSMMVRSKIRHRETIHELNRSFVINIKKLRTVRFSVDAMEIWKELKESLKPNLLDVQQAVNKLVITFQDINTNNVCKILSGKDIKLIKR